MRPRARALMHAAVYLERLLTSNSSRIQNDLIQRVGESRQQLEVEIRSRLSEALEVVGRALERARQRQTEGREAVSSEIERLETFKREVEELARGR
jgi:hypothetical protein